MQVDLQHDSLPKAILAVLLAVWFGLGLWFALKAPFGSGTDESIKYVAFAAARNRWATEEDFHRYGIEHFYYPPLYFLVFAPFWGDEPSFVEGYPDVDVSDVDPNYQNLAGRRTVTTSYLSRVPPPVERLYRQARLFSLGLGLLCLIALAATLRLLFSGPSGWWVVLLGTAPLIFLPQFLYYQTLVNNDSLVNALGALAALAFTAAVLSLERGSERRFVVLSLAVAACIGLAFLTKMSAPVLLPLALGLAWARFGADGGLAWKMRARRTLLLLVALAFAMFVSGGWWIGHQALQGDWSSFKAHRIAHPWAMVNPESIAGPTWWVAPLVQIVRTYYALFAGKLFVNIPDSVFLCWLVIPIAVLCCAAALVIARIVRGQPRSVESGRSLRRVVWVTLAGTFLLNVGSVLENLHFFLAAYGRLLFPSVVAVHVVAAAIVARTLRGRPRALAAVALVLVVYTGLLFGWTLRYRMAAAVLQPPEDVRILTGVGTEDRIGPVWEFAVEQAQNIPPGNLVALRVNIWRANLLPQFGAALEGTLRLRSARGQQQVVKVRRTALGDTDLSKPWAELELERAVRLDEVTPALLSLRGSPPIWLPEMNQFGYVCSDRGIPLRWDGAMGPCALCVAAVYRTD